MTREDIIAMDGGDDEELVFVEDLDDAMLGICRPDGVAPLVVYDHDVCLKILMSRKLTIDQAENFIDARRGAALFLERPDAF